MDVKRITARDIPTESLKQLSVLAGNTMNIDSYLEKTYGAKRSKELVIEKLSWWQTREWYIWEFYDEEKYTEFCLTWM